MSTKEIPLTQSQVAIVDECDFERVSAIKWHAVAHQGGFYAAARIKEKTFYMHRFVMGVVHEPRTVFVDHIDFNGLNNTKANLQVCTPGDNTRKRRSRRVFDCSKGVWKVRDGSYGARIVHEGRDYYLGVYESQREAAIAYDAAATVLFGRFAVRNYQ